MNVLKKEKENKIKDDFREDHLGNITEMRKSAKACFSLLKS